MTDQDGLSRQRILISALAAASGPSTALFETHISWVLVSGDFAYKFKKAVRFDFLDFSSLQSRYKYCLEELRLNGRLAPDIYQEVIAITGTPEQPRLGGVGPAIEYAVKMRAFGQEALWSHRLNNNLLSAADMDGLADCIARFHGETAIASPESDWCTPSALQSIADETLHQIAQLLETPAHRQAAAALWAWEEGQRSGLREIFLERKAAGCIRECHGDLHSGNILTLGNRVEVFDCIEFNESLRWIDVMNDIAFAYMDLQFRQRGDLAARFLNRYLELTGDYGGLRVLRYYEVHRALIRCKVALLRKVQCPPGSLEARGAMQEAIAYLDFALRRIQPVRPAILLAHGFSGCGKSTVARLAVETFDAIQLRSDVERKRMHGIPATSHAAAEGALYHPDVTQQTYDRLLALARLVAESGWSVIVDASFLRHTQRQPFRQLAGALGVPCLILDVRASEATMRARILARQQSGLDPSDAGVAVLERQLRDHDAFTEEEMAQLVVLDTESGVTAGTLRAIRQPALNAIPSTGTH